MRPKRLRLLQLVHGYPPAIGGVELSTQTLCERLVADYDVDVTVFTTDTYTISGFHDGSLPRIAIDPHEERNGVKIRRFHVETRWAPALEQLQRVAWHLRLPGNDRVRTWYHGPISPSMLRAVRDAEADVICAAAFPLNHLTYPFRRPEPRPPAVLVGAIHTTNAWGYDRPHLVRLTQRAFATVAHTEHERQWLIQRGAPPETTLVIGHGIDLAKFEPTPGAFREANALPADAFVVAYVGQQGGHKGIDTLVGCFPTVLASVPRARLVVAGATTPYSAKLRDQVERLHPAARERVLLLDDVSDATRAAVLADADVFASPSAEESFGITTLEAWSQRLPVVVGDTPAQRSIVDGGRNGMLVPYGDTAALAEALTALAMDDARRASLGEAGRRTLLDRYVLSDIVARYERLFRSAAGGTRLT